MGEKQTVVPKDPFCDLHPPLNAMEAKAESSRCLFCYDAPCIEACPTQINIPSFIRKIQTGNLKGSALDILSANILGGTCARVCPVETLCEHHCVRNASEKKPVAIGRLQRHATDRFFETGARGFERAKPTGKKVAVVGAGPAGLSCAHRLALLGHEVEIFEAKPKAGGLNEYGLAAYKMMDDFAQKEVEFVLSLGGIQLHKGKRLGREIGLSGLRKKFDAVFLGVGLGRTPRLNCPGEDLPGVMDAVSYIEQIRQAPDPTKLKIGHRVVVIGGGNTAIDIAVQAKQLGAGDVTVVYRRGQEQMGATAYEQELAQKNGVFLRFWIRPVEIKGSAQGVTEIECEGTRLNSQGEIESNGVRLSMPADTVFKAIGQTFGIAELGEGAELFELDRGKIKVGEDLQTSISGVYAGGDCIHSEDLTVVAVQDGKRAALAIDRRLREGASNG